LRLVGADGYAAIATLEMVTSGKAFSAYEWEGEPLPILHGFPVRAVFPEPAGNVWVKWLTRIEVLGSNSARLMARDLSPEDREGSLFR